jgi:hypothetical protein
MSHQQSIVPTGECSLLHAKYLRAFAELIPKLNTADRGVFHDLTYGAAHFCGIGPEKIGVLGRADRTTASRWVNGHCYPGELAAEEIAKRIAQKCISMAEVIEKSCITSEYKP